ncbi:MAG: tRNA lysidine(34) synthetase, partial [Candidatus Sulfotelmatobacter sp.]
MSFDCPYTFFWAAGLYHVAVHELAERVLGHIRREELLRAGDRVGVAVSGGIDSVALLRLLIELRHELGIVLSVVHFNHKLRAESDSDQEFVAGLAREYGLEFYGAGGDVAQLAAEEGSGVEAAARELRYGFFRRLLGAADEDDDLEVEPEAPQGLKPESPVALNGTAEAVPFANFFQPSVQARPTILDKIVTGHTLDDQAETVLMRAIRGTGLRGLGGIYPRILVERENEDGNGEIVRPLLGVRRRELEQYLADLKQPWREDST